MMDEQSLVGRGGAVGRRKNKEGLKTSQVHSSDWEGVSDGLSGLMEAMNCLPRKR